MIEERGGGPKQPGSPQEGQRSKYIIRRTANYWLRPGRFSAHDIPLPGRGLQCNHSIGDENNGNLTGEAPWIMGTALRNDYYNPEFPYRSYGNFFSYQSCQGDPQKVI